MKKVLSIAGSDSSGGAGIQADIKTMTVHKVFAMNVLTAITAQNTRGVTSIQDVSVDLVNSQLDAVFTDIYPDAIKIGMVSCEDTIYSISQKLKQYNAKNIVLDPVMVSTSGAKLLKPEAMKALIFELIPIADIITPNIYEAEILSNTKINNLENMVKAGEKIFNETKVKTLVKGGHLSGKKIDILISEEGIDYFEGKNINNQNTHGTGCTLSSAIASNIALGYDIKTSIKNAKEYVEGAISDMLDIGKGFGPLNHMYKL